MIEFSGARITVESSDIKLQQATASALYGILSSVRHDWMYHGTSAQSLALSLLVFPLVGVWYVRTVYGGC